MKGFIEVMHEGVELMFNIKCIIRMEPQTNGRGTALSLIDIPGAVIVEEDYQTIKKKIKEATEDVPHLIMPRHLGRSFVMKQIEELDRFYEDMESGWPREKDTVKSTALKCSNLSCCVESCPYHNLKVNDENIKPSHLEDNPIYCMKVK